MYRNYGVFPMYPMPMQAVASDAMILRQRHMDTLRCSYPTARAYENGNVWDIPFQLANSRPVTLRVTLPAMFPNVRPTVSIYPIITNPVINPETGTVLPETIGCLLNWYPHVDISSVINEVIKVLSVVLVSNPKSEPEPQPTPEPPQPVVEQEDEETEEIDTEPEDVNDPFRSCPEIESLSEADIDKLLNDSKAFELMFSSLPQVKQVKSDVERVKKLESELEELSKRADEAVAHQQQRKEEVKLKRDELSAKMKKKQELTTVPSLQLLAQLLSEAASKTESETDVLVEQLMNGSLEPNAFAKQFAAKRTLYHTRAAKVEAIQNTPKF